MSTLWTGTTGTLLGPLRDRVSELSFRDFLNGSSFDFLTPGTGKVQQVVHGAALVGAQVCDSDRTLAWNVNVEGSVRLLRAAAEAGARRFFFLSTSHVYAKSEIPLTEESETGPASFYAETKLVAEDQVIREAANLGISASVIRVFSVLGPTRNPASLAGLVGRVVMGSGEQIRNANDVRDFQTPEQYSKNIFRLISCRNLPNRLNLGSGKGMTVAQATRYFASAAGVEVSEAQFECGTSENPFVVADTSLFLEVTGIVPQTLNLTSTLETVDEP